MYFSQWNVWSCWQQRRENVLVWATQATHVRRRWHLKLFSSTSSSFNVLKQMRNWASVLTTDNGVLSMSDTNTPPLCCSVILLGVAAYEGGAALVWWVIAHGAASMGCQSWRVVCFWGVGQFFFCLQGGCYMGGTKQSLVPTRRPCAPSEINSPPVTTRFPTHRKEM